MILEQPHDCSNLCSGFNLPRRATCPSHPGQASERAATVPWPPCLSGSSHPLQQPWQIPSTAGAGTSLQTQPTSANCHLQRCRRRSDVWHVEMLLCLETSSSLCCARLSHGCSVPPSTLKLGGHHFYHFSHVCTSL